MTATLQTQESFRITATAASPAVALAIGSIASLLGIGPRQAADQLASFPSVLANQVPALRARQLSAMLALLGLRVRLDPAFSRNNQTEGGLDMALHPAATADCAALARHIEAETGPLPDLQARLDRPGGLILPGMTPAECLRLRQALRRIKGLWIAVSDPELAEFDLFAPASATLNAALSRLGVGPCRLSGAIVGGVNLTTGRILLEAAGPEALLLDRSFQRFDLILRAAPASLPPELRSFVATRTAMALPYDRPSPPVQIDRDLPRHAVEQFIADYATIGLDVSARLRGTLPCGLAENH